MSKLNGREPPSKTCDSGRDMVTVDLSGFIFDFGGKNTMWWLGKFSPLLHRHSLWYIPHFQADQCRDWRYRNLMRYLRFLQMSLTRCDHIIRWQPWLPNPQFLSLSHLPFAYEYTHSSTCKMEPQKLAPRSSAESLPVNLKIRTARCVDQP